MNVYILKIRVFVQILLDVTLNFIEQFNPLVPIVAYVLH